MRATFILFFSLLAATAARPGVAADAYPPLVIANDPPVGVVQRADGSFAYYNPGDHRGAVVRRTLDGREVRLEPAVDFDLPPDTRRTRLLEDDDGELHEVYLLARGEGRQIAVDRFIDLWHRRTTNGRAAWDEPQQVWSGYCGALMQFTRLGSGRIIAPFAAWLPDRAAGPPTGPNVVTAVFSDDGGRTWHESPSQLVAPCHEGYNGSNYGACEPVVLERTDGRLWMLMRTQTGWLYESWSDDDGHTWSDAAPARFRSSTGPPGVLRLPDGRIVVFWNNCQMPPRVDGAGVYAGRDALHAAISDDEGASWRGFREVYRDPYRNDTPPKTGDRGTAYPAAAYDAEGHVILISGQGRGRRNLIRIAPDWLTATAHEDDFSEGLDGWHVFKPFGPASGFWRDRTVGAALVDHPDKPGTHALAIRRLDERPADGATWNFPNGWQGRLTIRLLLRTGFQGASLTLADRMFEPTDEQGESMAVFRVSFDPQGNAGNGLQLALDQWHTLELRWNLDDGKCSLNASDAEHTLHLIEPTPNGVSYLRLSSLATTPDPAGILVDSVRAESEKTDMLER